VPRAGLPGYGLARDAIGVPLRIVEHAEAHPFEVGYSPVRRRPAPPGQSMAFTEREPARGRDGGGWT
jgi:hypothetical protein